jgi:lysyl-tRNA synthetase class II
LQIFFGNSTFGVTFLQKAMKRFDLLNSGAVFEKLIEPTLIQPTFVTHLPKELVPLAKLSPDDPTTVEVFECCINGQEIAPTLGVRRKIAGFWLI